MSAVAERAPIPVVEKQRIARAVFVAPISVKDIRQRLSDAGGKWNNNFSLTNVLLIQKGAASEASAGLIMAVGGTADKKETPAAAALREAAEETRSFALHEKRTRAKWVGRDPRTIEFTIPHDGHREPRALTIEVLPVSAFGVNDIPREKDNGPKSEDKIGGMLSLSPSEFKALVTKGNIRRGSEDLRAAGHFTIVPVDHDRIEIDDDQRAVQREVLTGVVQEVEEFDSLLKKYTLGAINKIRFLKGLDRIEDLADCDPDEITTGFVAAQMKLALTDERADETPEGPNKKISLLRALPYLTSDMPLETLSDLFLYLPTYETVHATQQLAQGFKEGLRVLIGSPLTNIPNAQDLRSRLSQDDVMHNIDAVAVFREVWPVIKELPDWQKIPLLRAASQAATKGLAVAFGVEYDVVTDAVRAADGFHNFMKNDLKGNGGSTHKYFQDFTPMNEITNARLFSMMVQALGYNPNSKELPDLTKPPEIEDRILRFEALRHLALVSVGIEVAEMLRNADNGLFEAALNTFLDKPKKRVIEVGEGQLLNVYDRVTLDEIDGRRWHIRVDEGLKKRDVSAIRKRFHSRELKDLLPISIILTDDNFKQGGGTVEERIMAAEAIRDQFIAHARKSIGEGHSGWTIEIDDHRTQSIEDIQVLAKRRSKLINELLCGIQRQPTPQEIASVDELLRSDDEYGGKGVNSQGDAIIRDKFFMVYKGPNGEEQTIEVNMYPFESTKSSGVEWLSKLGKWGHKEWSIDNAQGNYLRGRLTERDVQKTPMTPTLAEDLYLSILYADLMDKTGQVETLKSKLRRKSN